MWFKFINFVILDIVVGDFKYLELDIFLFWEFFRYRKWNGMSRGCCYMELKLN